MEKVFTLITGASSGIGRNIAIRLSRCRNIVINGRDRLRLAETRAQCDQSHEIIEWPFDLSNWGQLETVLSSLVEQYDIRFDSYVHSAGIVQILPLRVVTAKGMLDQFSVNLFSAMELTRLLTKKKLKLGSLNSIVFISSAASLIGEKGNSVYAATKGALNSFTRSAAIELAPSTRVNAILPGLVKTGMSQETLENTQAVAKILERYPLGLGLPEDISPLAEFLLSNDARWITGQMFVVDGGRVCA